MTTILMGPERTPQPLTDDGYSARRIEWIGESSVMDEPFVWTGIATKRFTPDQVNLLRRCALHRDVRTRDTERSMGPDDPKLSRLYTWNRRNKWIVLMTYADADTLLACSDGHCFRDLDAAEQDEPAVLYPPVELRLVSQSVLKTGVDRLEAVV